MLDNFSYCSRKKKNNKKTNKKSCVVGTHYMGFGEAHNIFSWRNKEVVYPCTPLFNMVGVDFVEPRRSRTLSPLMRN